MNADKNFLLLYLLPTVIALGLGALWSATATSHWSSGLDAYYSIALLGTITSQVVFSVLAHTQDPGRALKKLLITTLLIITASVIALLIANRLPLNYEKIASIPATLSLFIVTGVAFTQSLHLLKAAKALPLKHIIAAALLLTFSTIAYYISWGVLAV